MKRFYVELQSIYDKVESQTPDHQGNPCGDCSFCCEAGMESHHVTELELEFLESRTGPKKVADFRSYLQREKNEQGGLVFQTCPYYDQGCTIHAIRPLSCRLYGNYQTDAEVLPSFCVFKDEAIHVSFEDARTALPGNRELQTLATTHLSYSGGSSRRVRTPRRSRRRRANESPLERVMRFQVEERYLEALALIQELVAAEPNALHFEILAETQEALKRFEDAAASYRKCLEFTPDNPQLFYRMAAVLTWSGQYEEAKDALKECLQLAPRHQNATGFLGVVSSLEQDWENAKSQFSAAIALSEETGPYNFQLACTLERLGELELAIAEYKLSATYPPTEALSREALLRLGS